jgi:hypothetical protein
VRDREIKKQDRCKISLKVSLLLKYAPFIARWCVVVLATWGRGESTVEWKRLPIKTCGGIKTKERIPLPS